MRYARVALVAISLLHLSACGESPSGENTSGQPSSIDRSLPNVTELLAAGGRSLESLLPSMDESEHRSLLQALDAEIPQKDAATRDVIEARLRILLSPDLWEDEGSRTEYGQTHLAGFANSEDSSKLMEVVSSSHGVDEATLERLQDLAIDSPILKARLDALTNNLGWTIHKCEIYYQTQIRPLTDRIWKDRIFQVLGTQIGWKKSDVGDWRQALAELSVDGAADALHRAATGAASHSDAAKGLAGLRIAMYLDKDLWQSAESRHRYFTVNIAGFESPAGASDLVARVSDHAGLSKSELSKLVSLAEGHRVLMARVNALVEPDGWTIHDCGIYYETDIKPLIESLKGAGSRAAKAGSASSPARESGKR